MRGNSFGKLFSLTSFGESHGAAIGVVLDGVPSGLTFDLQALHNELKRRAPGQSAFTTARKEDDAPEVLSGIFEGKTLGTPICVIVKNTDQRSQDYKAEDYRPGHADKTTEIKFGIRDYRGGGRSSGRETIARVIAGYFASLILPQMKAFAWSESIGTFKNGPVTTDERTILGFTDEEVSKKVETFLLDCKAQGESSGGVVGLKVTGAPAGLGEPAFDKLKADLAKAMLSLPGCLGIEIGAGFAGTQMPGSELSKDSKNFGGMEGGITNGEDLLLRVAFKAPSTLGDKAKAGRHDPCLLPRVLPVVEAMAKIVIADHHLRQRAYLTGGIGA
ncbi:MAG: chorismate synthase [Bacteriovoracaceae bacterium]|nr:chorismate synthase [Bacteriovoracaceae bacterium]